MKYSYTSTSRGNQAVDKFRWLYHFHLCGGKGGKAHSNRSANMSRSPGRDTALHICQCRKAVPMCLGYSEWIWMDPHKGIFNSVSRATAWWALKSQSNSPPGILDYSLVLWDICSKGLWENMIKGILSFKKVADSKGRVGKGEVAGKTALPMLRYPVHPEKRRNCLYPTHHNLLPFQSPLSVYKHLWRLLKGNRSQGVKEISVANQFVLRHQHRSSWHYPWKIMDLVERWVLLEAQLQRFTSACKQY